MVFIWIAIREIVWEGTKYVKMLILTNTTTLWIVIDRRAFKYFRSRLILKYLGSASVGKRIVQLNLFVPSRNFLSFTLILHATIRFRATIICMRRCCDWSLRWTTRKTGRCLCWTLRRARTRSTTQFCENTKQSRKKILYEGRWIWTSIWTLITTTTILFIEMKQSKRKAKKNIWMNCIVIVIVIGNVISRVEDFAIKQPSLQAVQFHKYLQQNCSLTRYKNNYILCHLFGLPFVIPFLQFWRILFRCHRKSFPQKGLVVMVHRHLRHPVDRVCPIILQIVCHLSMFWLFLKSEMANFGIFLNEVWTEFWTPPPNQRKDFNRKENPTKTDETNFFCHMKSESKYLLNTIDAIDRTIKWETIESKCTNKLIYRTQNRNEFSYELTKKLSVIFLQTINRWMSMDLNNSTQCICDDRSSEYIRNHILFSIHEF